MQNSDVRLSFIFLIYSLSSKIKHKYVYRSSSFELKISILLIESQFIKSRFEDEAYASILNV